MNLKNFCYKIFLKWSYLSNIREAMEKDGVDVLGYSVWSIMDSFEWYNGFR